jgi:hypothetical protein
MKELSFGRTHLLSKSYAVLANILFVCYSLRRRICGLRRRDGRLVRGGSRPSSASSSQLFEGKVLGAIARQTSKFPARAGWDSCEGFSVDSADGHVGVVRAVRYAPDSLAVSAGRSGDIVLIISFEEIERVIFGQRRIIVRSSVSNAATDGVGAGSDGAEENGRGGDPEESGENPSLRIVAAARRRVLAGWCQGHLAEDNAGVVRDALSTEARRWSILGALIASWGRGPVTDLGRAVAALHTPIDNEPLEVWNDRPDRTQQEVAAVLAQAIDSLRREDALA